MSAKGRWIIDAVDRAGNSWTVGRASDLYEALRMTLDKQPGEALRVSYDDEDGRMVDLEQVISDAEWNAETQAMVQIPEAWKA